LRLSRYDNHGLFSPVQGMPGVDALGVSGLYDGGLQ
jgi:hypothetical protein